MSDTVVTTQNGTDVSKYMYQIRKLKDALTTVSRDRDSFKAEADQYRKDNADLKAKSDTSALAKRNQELEGQLREVAYRKTWDRVALARGIRPDALDIAYQHGGYKPDGEEIDEEAIGVLIDGQKTKLPFLAAPKAETPAKTEAKQVAGSGQGVKSGGAGTFQLPAENDPRWNDNMWQWKHRKEIAQAVREKEAQGTV